jgi:hypothetical protein
MSCQHKDTDWREDTWHPFEACQPENLWRDAQRFCVHQADHFALSSTCPVGNTDLCLSTVGQHLILTACSDKPLIGTRPLCWQVEYGRDVGIAALFLVSVPDGGRWCASCPTYFAPSVRARYQVNCGIFMWHIIFFFFFYLGPVCLSSGSTSAFKAYCAWHNIAAISVDMVVSSCWTHFL